MKIKNKIENLNIYIKKNITILVLEMFENRKKSVK